MGNGQVRGRRMEEAALDEALSLLFSKYDRTGDGQIHLDEVEEMVIELRERYSDRSKEDVAATAASLAKIIMTALDADQDGAVDKEEWMKWLKAGLTRSQEDRARFRKTEARRRLDDFLSCIEVETAAVPKIRRELRLRKMFSSFDLDNDGKLNPQELEAMTRELGSAAGLASFDSFAEFLDWFCGEAKEGGEEMRRGIEMSLLDPAERELCVKVSALFARFDADADGHLTQKEISAMISFCKTEQGCMEDVAFVGEDSALVVKALDANGNGQVELSELTSWIRKGTRMSAATRTKYMSESDRKARMVRFLNHPGPDRH